MVRIHDEVERLGHRIEVEEVGDRYEGGDAEDDVGLPADAIEEVEWLPRSKSSWHDDVLLSRRWLRIVWCNDSLVRWRWLWSTLS